LVIITNNAKKTASDSNGKTASITAGINITRVINLNAELPLITSATGGEYL
jgi:hypothetical protein